VYHNRAIDIDILFYGNERIDTEDLIVPHPLIGERDFVKIPLAEIAKPSLRNAFPEYFM
jgi:2-amino-4-hydroxy-6-hydroxymethyldihydropteridine diphosphokinase